MFAVSGVSILCFLGEVWVMISVENKNKSEKVRKFVRKRESKAN